MIEVCGEEKKFLSSVLAQFVSPVALKIFSDIGNRVPTRSQPCPKWVRGPREWVLVADVRHCAQDLRKDKCDKKCDCINSPH